MVKLQSKAKNFINLLNLIKLTGKDSSGATVSLMYGCVLKAHQDILVKVLNKSSVVFAKINYKKISILEQGNLPIGDIEEFLSYLTRFKPEEQITVETHDNKILILGSNKKASLNLIVEETIEESSNAESLSQDINITPDKATIKETELNNKIVINAEDLQEFLKDADVKNIARKFNFILTPEELICRVGSIHENFIETKVNPEFKQGTCSVFYQAGIDNVVSNLEGKITIYLAKNSPMLIKKEGDDYNAIFLIAPLEISED